MGAPPENAVPPAVLDAAQAVEHPLRALRRHPWIVAGLAAAVACAALCLVAR